ncbi:MAG: HlyD family secretion protein [Clostridium sp.]|jgi:multidrug efflux pump subunit AcrA (membrane-fusion protein)
MKRYIILFISTLIAIAAIFAVGSTIKKSILKVDVIKLEPVSEVESVVCTGKVETISGQNVFVPANAIAKKIYVNVGQKVEKGQALMDIAVNSLQDSNSEESYACYADNQSDSNLETVQTLTAPISGTIAFIPAVAEGYCVGSTSPAIIIRGDTGLQVRLNVNESQISDIKVGQNVEITGVGFKNSCYSGTVTEIASEAKQIMTASGQETVVEVLVTVNQPKEDIKPGFTAKAKIITSNHSSVLVVPYSAVQADQDGAEYVLRVVEGMTVKTPIKTAREFDNGFEVVSGVTADDWIVTNPENLSAGIRVIPIFHKAVNGE